MSPGGLIKDTDIDAVRERTDIVQLISEFVPLKKSGRQFRGPCPFHQEKDPSFYVDPAKGLFPLLRLQGVAATRSTSS